MNMSRLAILIAIVAMTGNAEKTTAQSAWSVPAFLDYPQGVWESMQPDGSTIGIDLVVAPAWDLNGASIRAGFPSDPVSLVVGVYQRKRETIKCGEMNFFSVGRDSTDPEDVVRYFEQKLVIRNLNRWNNSNTSIELRYDSEKNVWRGQIHRGSFNGYVNLHRVAKRSGQEQGGCQAPGSAFPINGKPASASVAR